jgi:H+/Cl- antiporter ClcA
MFGIAEIIVIIVSVFLLAGSIFWIWAILDCARYESPADNDKIVWILIILLLHWVGALLYTLVRRPQRLSGES